MPVTVPPAPSGAAAWVPSASGVGPDADDEVPAASAPSGPASVPPPRVPVLALRDAVGVPTVTTALLVGRPASVAAVEAAVSAPVPGPNGDERWILLVAQRDAGVEAPAPAGLYRVGVAARVQQAARLPNGTVKLVVEGARRVRVTRYLTAGGVLRGQWADLPLEGVPAEGAALPAEQEAELRQLLALFEEYAGGGKRLPAEAVNAVREAPGAERRAWGVLAHVAAPLARRQALLESASLGALVAALASTIAEEVALAGLERAVDERVRGAIAKGQREFWLAEQLKVIHQELGKDDADDADELEARVRAKGLPEVAEARALREVRRLRRMPPVSPEATVARTLLDWVLALPWRETSDAPPPDLARARAALDADHFGLDEVKERVLDYLAVLALAARRGVPNGPSADAASPGDAAARPPVLCLVGPPGVGKTSLARSVARALGRPFVRLSLGGVRDEAEVRGHRRTYVGAQPGRVMQAIRKAGVADPVLLLDEVDKMGSDWRGDPSAALLEVLDPEQHHAFVDHFLELEYDLSRVLFITTANALAGVPEPLRDRMEVVRVSGYLEPEKLAIAEWHLVPKQLRRAGIDPAGVAWEPGALAAVVRGWTREAGVRELERRVGQVARKLARRAVEGEPVPAAPGVVPSASEGPTGLGDGAGRAVSGPVAGRVGPSVAALPRDDSRRRRRAAKPAPTLVRTDDLPALLGPAPFDADDHTLDDKVGVANGLAYTAAGGELLEVEVSVVPGRGRVQLTGTLGDVMKESAGAAVSWVRARARTLGVDPDFYRTSDVHVHLPAGATPKDGPSAGVTIAAALVSALTGVPLRGDVAMTGEISLRGRVLPVGGLKEKAVAAHRHGVAHVVVPRGNARAVDELPAEVRAGLAWHPAASMDEVLALVLRRDPQVVAASAPGDVPRADVPRADERRPTRRPRAARGTA